MPVARTAIPALVALALAGCGPRTQTVLFVETDLPVPQLADTLRVEQLDAKGAVVVARNQVVLNADDWPVSFGVVSTDGKPVVLRLRLFSAARVTGGQPRENFAVDRLVALPPPSGAGEIDDRVALLSGECIGIPADLTHGSSCLSSAQPSVAASEGLAVVAGPPSTGDVPLGTWSELRPVPCDGAPRAETGLHDEEVCIPGGAFFLGDERLAPHQCTHGAMADPGCSNAPERLVRISPFYLDRFEVTVGRFRAALARGFSPANTWRSASNSPSCNFDSNDKSTNPLPMNCVTSIAARAFCAFDGRRLPTEAEWEFAASGRGEERMWPWGDDEPTCDRASYGRNPAGAPSGDATSASGCATADNTAVEAVGSHPSGRSRDGVDDLAGSLFELQSDFSASYDESCWPQTPHPLDPTCAKLPQPGEWTGGKTAHTMRGGAWDNLALALDAGLRDWNSDDDGKGGYLASIEVGFRCARSGITH